MNPHFLKAALCAALPLVALSAVAAKQFIGATFFVAGAPNLAKVRLCGGGDPDVSARAHPTDSVGNIIGSTCQSVSRAVGTTNWAPTGASTICNGSTRHRVGLAASNGGPDTMCSGTSGSLQHSGCWNSDLSNNTCVSSCSRTNLQVKFSTDNGATWSACQQRTITGYSFGKTE